MNIRIFVLKQNADAGLSQILDVEKVNGDPVDFYNEILYAMPRISFEHIPRFLQNVIDRGCDNNGGGFTFGPIDDEGAMVGEDEVEFYVPDYKIIYPMDEVLDVALETGRKALEAENILGLKEKGIVGAEWVDGLKEAIVKIEAMR